MPFVYVLKCRDGSLYTGAAKDVSKRFLAHQAGTASKYTRARLPVVLVWSKRVRTWSRALRLEWEIKRLTRERKLALISFTRAHRRITARGLLLKITGIRAYHVALPLKEGSYKWSGGKAVSVFDSTVVEVETDGGITGWGEVCPLGPFYLPAYGAGARVGIAELGPHLIGEDPRELDRLNRLMDAALKGHPYVKSAIDMACWDILGKATGLPACVLLGGRFGDAVDLYRAISQESASKMAARVAAYRAEGYRKFQLKVGANADDDIARIKAVRAKLGTGDVLVADANTGWLMHDAARVVRGVQDVDVYIEQPCLSYEECLAIRRRTNHPFVLDETIDSVGILLRAHADGAMDVINLKISKVGGLTRARQIRDLCVSLGIAMTIEDSWGGDITTAAIAHLAHSTPEAFRFSATDFNSYVTVSTAEGAPQRKNGRMAASTAPGLGVKPRMKVLGKPVVSLS